MINKGHVNTRIKLDLQFFASLRELPEGEYWMYLRKSRADLEAELRGEGETLAKHRKALYKVAQQYNINITRVFQEIESGESIFHRPEMVKMLETMETSPPKGVLCMDIDRLGRGDKIDQGIIERSFKQSRTLIVTPTDIYDMNQESGEFNVEVRSFLARMELKQTTKRLQGGRIRSVEEGNYIGTRPPYGYRIYKDDKERYLVSDPETSQVVRQMFEWYTVGYQDQGRIGSSKIADILNERRIKTATGILWEPSIVLNILRNAVYMGRIQWKKKEQKKSTEPGKKRDTRTRPKSEWIDVKGKHEPLVSEDTYKLAQEIMSSKGIVPTGKMSSPLAGVVKCGKCGFSMVYRPYGKQKPHMICPNRQCDNKSARFEFIESRILFALDEVLKQYKHTWGSRRKKNIDNDVKFRESVVQRLERELKELEEKKRRLHDFLESGTYDEETYLERSRVLTSEMEKTKAAITQAHEDYKKEKVRAAAQKEIIPTMENVIRAYKKSKSIENKNALLKSVLAQATYTKEKNQRLDEFTLTITPKIPR